MSLHQQKFLRRSEVAGSRFIDVYARCKPGRIERNFQKSKGQARIFKLFFSVSKTTELRDAHQRKRIAMETAEMFGNDLMFRKF